MSPKPSASPVLGGSCAPSTSTNLACRLVQIALALYLIPTLLIVLLVGAVGMLMDAKSARKYRHADRLPSESFIPRT